MPLKIGIVAGEASGDQLGAGLMQALKILQPDSQFEGVAGPKMIAAGCKTLFLMEQLAVMGLVEVLKHAPRILAIRRQLSQHFLNNPPDIFIGIDAPDFNLTLEAKLKQAGICTVHYVSPTVWAWRKGRIKKITRAVDLLLSIFPFEQAFYQRYSALPVHFIGHPLADTIALKPNRSAARAALGIAEQETVIAILPGSRANEIHYLGELFVRTALWCRERYPNLSFIAPMANAARAEQFNAICQSIAPQLDIHLVNGQAQQAMAAANVVLLASGTATLETMLMKRPMVVAYRMSSLTYFIAKRLITTSYIAQPNLLADQMLVPEFIQDAATPENLGKALLDYLTQPQAVEQLIEKFTQLHLQMRKDASLQAAQAIVGLLK